MFKLLNRFAWVISIILGIVIIGFFSGFFYFLGEFIFFITTIFLILIIKKSLFSSTFIKERLEFFANAIENKKTKNNDSFVKNEKKENIEIDKIKNKVDELKNEDIKYKSLELKENIETKLDKIGFGTKSLEEEKIGINDLPDEGFETIKKENPLSPESSLPYREKGATIISKEKILYESSPTEIFFEKLGTYIKNFFSTNILAKIGGILLFLMVVYFLKGLAINVWEIIGPIGRVVIGIIIGFIIYFSGIKLHKKYKQEGLILMGTGILINYAVILAGRHLVGGNELLIGGNKIFFAETTTFLFLILNTILGILTSLIYKSKTLLIFSFIFAYINPFIIGTSGTEPYTLVGYSFIVSLGALFLANKQNNLTLLIISFIFGNLLFFAAPFSDSIGWSVKIIFTIILSIISIKIAYNFSKDNISGNILYIFLGTYFFIILNLFNSSGFLSETFSFLAYNIALIGLFAFSIYFLKNFVKDKESGIFSIFIIPFVIIILILFSGDLIFSSFTLTLFLILFLLGFSVIEKNISNYYKYFLFIFLGFFIFLFNLELNIIGNLNNVNNLEFFTILFSSFIFLFFSYYYSTKKDLSTLFPIGTIGTIITFAPYLVISNNNSILFLVSIIAIIIFAISNFVLPFINKRLFEKQNLYNLIIGVVASALFISFQIYNYGEIYFPGVIEGFAFLALAIVYFLQAYFFIQKIGIENVKKDESLKNIFYTFAGISISIFSVSMVFVFSKYPEIITTVWLFEATILYYIFSRNNSKKIFIAATILFFIGLTQFGILIDEVKSENYLFLVSFSVILASFILNLFFIEEKEINPSQPSLKPKGRSIKEKNIVLKNIHYILHIIGMIIMGILLYEIIPSNGNGWSKFGIIIFITILGFFYSKLNTNFLKYVFVVIILGFSIFHIGDINNIFSTLEVRNLEYLKILQYLVTGILVFNIFIWKKSNNPSPSGLPLEKEENIGNKKINLTLKIILGIYAFLVSNIYVLDIFKNNLEHFSLTLYWGLIASVLLIYGIQKDLQKFRTIGLYFLVLTISKIFLFDVWEVGDITSRYIIFGILGVVLIIISTLYTKKYGDNLLSEFSFDNLKDKEKTVNKKIKNIDVSIYKWVVFKDNTGVKTRMRSKKLMQIIKLILSQVKKDNFEADELKSVYENIKNNYHSDLDKEKYNEYISILENFVKKGGTIKFEKKD